MNVLGQLLSPGATAAALLAVSVPAIAALPPAVSSSNQLYLVISNGPSAVFLTAYNTAADVSYQIQTNMDVTNPNGWGTWVTVLATNNITPLSSLTLDVKEVFFRAVTVPANAAGTTLITSPQYLGRLEISTDAKQNTRSAALIPANSQSNRDLVNWGQTADPDGDCNFYTGRNSVVISVPGSGNPHDLAAEIQRTNAPRVTQEINGDFTIQVKTDGRFEPGETSTLRGRTAYNGAALIITSDPQNVVTLARAVLQRPGVKPTYYANFEMRSGGGLERIGLTGDLGLPAKGPVWLRLQRRGSEISGAVSLDGAEWNSLGLKTISSNWPANLSAGIAAISTSQSEFDPRFSDLKVSK